MVVSSRPTVWHHGRRIAAVALALALVGCATPPADPLRSEPAPPQHPAASAPVPEGPSAGVATPGPFGTDRPPEADPAPQSPEPSADRGSLAQPPAPAIDRGLASWYGRRFHGRRTASGERYDMHAFTAAHRTLPFGTRVRVRSVHSGREVVVRINDRGPFHRARIIDLSQAAFSALGRQGHGVTQVELLPE